MVMPKSQETVWKHIESFYEAKFEEQKTIITEKKSKGMKFSVSLDEWTDINGRRFVIIFLHDCKEVFNLGLIPIPPGHCTTKVLTDIVQQHLKTVGLDPTSDVVASTTDGASTVVKVASELEVTGKMCDNHAFHLAVTDVVYNKIKPVKSGENHEYNGKYLN